MRRFSSHSSQRTRSPQEPQGHEDDDLQMNRLDEVTAPSPACDSSEKTLQRHDCLENLRPNTSSGPLEPARPHEAIADAQQTEHAQPGALEDSYSHDQHTKRSRRHLRKYLTTLYTLSYLIVFSFIGTLLRLAIASLTLYPGAPVNTSVLWANVGGSFIMGFLSEDHRLFRSKEVESRVLTDYGADDKDRLKASLKAHKKTVPLYIGLTTGFCGCLTSFSSFIRDVFLALANLLPVPLGPYSDVSMYTISGAAARAPNGGYSFMAIVAVLATEIALSLASIFLGAHVAILLTRWTPAIPHVFLRRALDPLMPILACFSWVAVICLVSLLPHLHKDNSLWSHEVWRGPVLFSLVFAPVGCLLRFFLSLKLNSRIASFPLGTFAANIVGTLILGMAYDLQHASSIGPSLLGGGSLIGCQVLQGIMDGFCGCLTTVGTWVLELSDLRRRHAYVYGIASVAAAFGLLIIEIGSLKWTVGLTTPDCFAR